MSLINQMLQDLDARRAAHGVGSRLPNDVRPLPKPQASPLPIIVGVLVLLVLAAGFTLFIWETRQPAVPTPLALPAPEPEKIVQAEPTTAAPASLSASTLQELGGSLRMAESIKPPAEKLAGAKADTASAATGKPVVALNKTDDERSQMQASTTRIPVENAPIAQGSGKSARN